MSNDQPQPDEKEMKKLQRKLDAQAIKVVHEFIARYMELEENDDNGHEKNESDLIEGLCDIYDPQDEMKDVKVV